MNITVNDAPIFHKGEEVQLKPFNILKYDRTFPRELAKYCGKICHIKGIFTNTHNQRGESLGTVYSIEEGFTQIAHAGTDGNYATQYYAIKQSWLQKPEVRHLSVASDTDFNSLFE